MKNKRKSLFLPLILIWVVCLLAAVVYGAVRYSLLMSGGATASDALTEMLPEALPVAAVVLLAGAAEAVYFVVCVKKPVDKMRVSAQEMVKRVESGAANEPVSAAGCLSRLAETLYAEEEKMGDLLVSVAQEADTQARREERQETARAILSSISPETLSFGGLTYGVYAKTLPCAAVGADFCDGFETDKRHVFVAVGDVWGRGLPAALFAAKLRVALREEIIGGRSPAEALASVNAKLIAGNKNELAATLFCAMFDFNSGELKYANAGHLPPLIAGETVGFLRVRAGAPLGLFSDAAYQDETFALRPGQGLFLYTDGVVNIGNGKEFFGYDRLFATLKQYYGNALNADSVAEGVLSAAAEFGKREDDLAALALYFPAGVQRLLRPETADLEKMRELLDHWLAEDPRKKNIQLACEEIFTNIVNHAGAKAIQISCEKEESSLIIRFTDDGEPFNPLQAENGGKEFYSYAEGGMGMTIIRRIAGEIFYRTKQNLNVLTIRFPIIKGI